MVVFLCLLLALVAGYAFWLQQQGQSLGQQLHSSATARAALERELAKYRPIMDVEAYARRSREEADAYSARTRTQTDQEVASLLRSSAEHERKTNEILGEAQQQGAAIIATASRRAQQIAGEALEAKANAAKLADTVQAMRNIIDGYGDLYLVPTPDLLDELAQEVGFSEPGKKLKEARDQVRMMIKTRNAATCNEMNPNRRLLAIHFVLDAFNGKADSILSVSPRRITSLRAGESRCTSAA